MSLFMRLFITIRCVMCVFGSGFNFHATLTEQHNCNASNCEKVHRVLVQVLAINHPRECTLKLWCATECSLPHRMYLMQLERNAYVFENECFIGHGWVFIEQRKLAHSWAALTVCAQDMQGFLLIDNIGYTLEQWRRRTKTKSKRNAVSDRRGAGAPNFFNLTGDTITFDVQRDLANNAEFSISSANNASADFTPRDPFTANGIRRDQKDAASDDDGVGYNGAQRPESNFDPDGNWPAHGYFFDSAWKTVIAKARKSTTTLKNPAQRYYMHIAIGVDESVIRFHGRARVRQYVLTLLNIVNAIYQDPSLDARLQIVVKALHLYEKKRHVIKLGNAKKSLENVNVWNKDLHAQYKDDDEPHDVALWLTRTDIGGPSGYAPVGGVCDPERSCALTRDEGLTCAFIIAHELAHVLGLTHDGDAKNNNTCKDDALQGSVMAPMVSATFHHFLWSECSRREFALKITKWQCLLDAPDLHASTSIALNATLDTTFTMDEQCRVEFGDGYTLCRSFDIVEPCAHLWCGHIDAPYVCKTKKGPPLEGTECGPQKWCIDGYCDSTLRIGLDPIKHNALDGAWSEWGVWSTCSRTCGVGMQFRGRTCDSPKPAHGGRLCAGDTEEWRVCNTRDCLDVRDFRAQQCVRMPRLLAVPPNYTWLPFESEQNDLKCKYICQTGETGEVYASEENLADGTPCSYDNDEGRCVQGTCVHLGCDHRVNSTLALDACGECNGNGTKCMRTKLKTQKNIKKQLTRVAVLHNRARHIAMELIIDGQLWHDVELFMKDRKRSIYRLHLPSPTTKHAKLSKTASHHNDVVIERKQIDSRRRANASSRAIVQGARFRLEYSTVANHSRITLTAKGPILTELILFMHVKNLAKSETLKARIRVEYVLHRKHNESRYEWIVGGWGSCSRSCGGGRRLKTKACVERVTQRIVPRKFCSIANKPSTETQPCNNFSCNFEWIAGEWEPCSTTCGTKGVQHREVYCTPKYTNPAPPPSDLHSAPWRYMLPPEKCGYQPPATSQPCARTFCPGHWTFPKWSTCSSSGVQNRQAYCTSDNATAHQEHQEEEFRCGTDARNGVKQYQICAQPGIPCTEDASPLCGVSLLKRYCRIEEFSELCCHTCGLNTRLTPIQF